jgi:hypothetical protein
MKFLAVSTNTEDVSEFATAEFQRLDELRADGTLTDGWLKSDISGAILVLECADEGEASDAIDTLPTVINGATTVFLTQIIDLDSVRPSLG